MNMPYIERKSRAKWKSVIEAVKREVSKLKANEIEGELNYLITSILHGTYRPKYFSYNRAIGLLECIKLEFYRKKVAKYEDKKEKENGPVEI